MAYLQSSIHEAMSMNRAQLLAALAPHYKYGPPAWMTYNELVATWLERFGTKELARYE